MKNDERPVLHVVFGMSAAGSLLKALDRLGRRERVIGSWDDLSFGPVSDAGGASRAAWIGEELGYEIDEVEDAESLDRFWSEAADTSVRPVAWLNRRCAREYAGFLEFVWRLRGAPCQVVDLTDAVFRWQSGSPAPATSFGFVNPSQMVDADLVNRASLLCEDDRHAHEGVWARLKREDAPLRIVTAAGLSSAPITYFDDLVVSCVGETWTKCAFVVGTAMGRLADEPYHQTGDLVLWSRLRSLSELGAVECRGEMLSMHDSFVRKPSGSSSGPS